MDGLENIGGIHLWSSKPTGCRNRREGLELRMAIVVVHQEAESGSRHIKVIGPMQHDADVNQARLLPPGGASRVLSARTGLCNGHGKQKLTT